MNKIEKYSLSIYHFNLQYKAGDKKSYFKLIEASFQPFLKFFLENSNWKVDLELQGHFIAFLARHFPDDLENLIKLNERNQIEIVNVHYSDQIYLAYPYLDMQMSFKFCEEIFKRYNLKRSSVFFAQENFFGEGAEKYMVDHGYSIALLNQHYYSHHYGKPPYAPYYKYKNIDVLLKTTHGYKSDDKGIEITQKFSYWGDGELAFARGNNYMPFYGPSKKAYLNHKIKYRKLELEGFKMITVEDYIKRMKQLNIQPMEIGPLTDGSWNMRYYGGVYLWMGTYRLPWERDADIRSLTYRAREKLIMTEQIMNLVNSNGIKIPKNLYGYLKLAWKHLLLAEVSDSTGQTPVPIEIYYSINESNEVYRYCNLIIKKIKEICEKNEKKFEIPIGKFIDTSKSIDELSSNHDSAIINIKFYPPIYGIFSNLQEIESNESYFEKLNFNQVKELFSIENKSFFIRFLHMIPSSIKINFYKPNNEIIKNLKIPIGVDLTKIEQVIFDVSWVPKHTAFLSRILAFARTEKNKTFSDLFDRKFGNYAGIILPLFERKLIYCPALMETEPKEYLLDQFDFKNYRTWLGLPNGLIGLGKDRYLIKHNSFGNTCIAITLSLDNQFLTERPAVCLITLNPPRVKFNWRISIVKGPLNEVTKLANRININPILPII